MKLAAPALLALLAGCPAGGAEDDDEPPAEPTPDLRGPFALPLEDPARVRLPVIGFDHDPESHDDEGAVGRAICRNYADERFPTCYDGHDGTDLVLDGGFAAMDEGSMGVLAAAGGVVTEAVEDQYDRCHADAGTGDVSCDGFPMVANRVVIQHGDGLRSRYFHLKQWSVEVEVGDEVACGDFLALIGSSGRSSFPHLHFEVNDADGAAIDPYAGVRSQPESLWVQQDGPWDLPGADCR